jgi:hypothetical protein
MEIAVTDAPCGKPVKVWRIDVRAIAAKVGEAGIVEKDEDDVWTPIRWNRRIGPLRRGLL